MAPTLPGNLLVTVVEGIDIKNSQLFSKSDPFVQLQVRETRNETSVKDNDNMPTWNESFQFLDITSDDVLTVTLMDKGTKNDFVGEGQVSCCKWGTLGQPATVDVPLLMLNKKTEAGTVKVSLVFEPTAPFRAPFKVVAGAAAKTQQVTTKCKVDPVINAAIKALTKPVSLFLALSNFQKAGVVAAAAAAFACTTAALAIPALIFLPVTLFLGFLLVAAAVVALPVVLLLAWLLACSRPVQEALWRPTLVGALKTYPMARSVLLAPTTEQ